MGKPRPLRWIEEAEARQVLTTAQSEAPAPPFAGAAAKKPWTERLRRWVAAGPAGPSREPNAAPAAAVEPPGS